MSSTPTTFAYGLPRMAIMAGDTALDPSLQESQEGVINFDAGTISVTIHKPEEMADVIVSGTDTTRIRVTTLVLSSFAITSGLFDIALFLFNDNYLFHPYFALTILVAGSFLLATTVLAVRGK